jgi:NADH-ubiquinone/plastoquinone oxidoreductase, chain 3
MNELLLDYLPLVIFIGVALVISLVLLLVPFVVAYQAPDPEKLSAYECGFNAFDDARMKFDVRFYHHLRSGDELPVSLGHRVERSRAVRLLVDDGVPWRSDHRLHI